MADVKYDTKYYVRIPGHYVYLQENNGLIISFAKFFNSALPLNKADALRIAEKYGLEVVERITTTTTEVSEKTI